MGEDDDKAAERVCTYWKADQVHMGQDGYRKLVSTLLDKVATVADKTSEDRQLAGQQQHKKILD
jgi:hypothetical protein